MKPTYICIACFGIDKILSKLSTRSTQKNNQACDMKCHSYNAENFVYFGVWNLSTLMLESDNNRRDLWHWRK